MRYVVLGLGSLGRRRRDLLGARCVATVDPYNPTADHTTPDKVPDNSYDAAVLSIPNAAKLELIEQFLQRGKSVLIDKPLIFADDAQAERLRTLASANKAIWYTSYNHRFEPLIVALKRVLDDGRLGRLYHARLLYGNGTVGNVVGSWRDSGIGVVEDLGSHLLDLTAYLFGWRGELEPFVLQRHEATSYDQAILRSSDGRFILETTYVSWKNSFAVEAWCEHGSAHLHGLRKWGPVELVVRQRVRPSGAPEESCEDDAGPDETWAADLEHFERRVAEGSSSFENDLWISRTLRAVPAA